MSAEQAPEVAAEVAPAPEPVAAQPIEERKVALRTSPLDPRFPVTNQSRVSARPVWVWPAGRAGASGPHRPRVARQPAPWGAADPADPHPDRAGLLRVLQRVLQVQGAEGRGRARVPAHQEEYEVRWPCARCAAALPDPPSAPRPTGPLAALPAQEHLPRRVADQLGGAARGRQLVWQVLSASPHRTTSTAALPPNGAAARSTDC